MDEIERSKEPVVFVPTGKPFSAGQFEVNSDGEVFKRNTSYPNETKPGYVRLPTGWTAEAVERLFKTIRDRGDWKTSKEDILAALFPTPEPEPAPWMREAAEACWKESAKLGRENPIDTFARIIAKHAGGAK